MIKEPTVSIGPGLFRIYSMCVKIRVPVFGQRCTQNPYPSPPPQAHPSLQKYTKPFSRPGIKMSVVLDIASHVSESVGRA